MGNSGYALGMLRIPYFDSTEESPPGIRHAYALAARLLSSSSNVNGTGFGDAMNLMESWHLYGPRNRGNWLVLSFLVAVSLGCILGRPRMKILWMRNAVGNGTLPSTHYNKGGNEDDVIGISGLPEGTSTAGHSLDIVYGYIHLLEGKTKMHTEALEKAVSRLEARMLVLERKLDAFEEVLSSVAAEGLLSQFETPAVPDERFRRSCTFELTSPFVNTPNLMAVSFGSGEWDSCADLGSPATPRRSTMQLWRKDETLQRRMSPQPTVFRQRRQSMMTTMSAMSLSEFVANLRSDLNETPSSPNEVTVSCLPTPSKSSHIPWEVLATELGHQIGFAVDLQKRLLDYQDTICPVDESIDSQETEETVVQLEEEPTPLLLLRE